MKESLSGIGTDRDTPSSLDSMIRMWNGYIMTGSHDSTLISARKVMTDALDRGDSLTALYAGIFTAQSFLVMEYMVDSAKFYADKIEGYARRSGIPSPIIAIDNIMAGWYLKTELNYSKALEFYLDGLNYAERYNLVQNKIIMLANIVTIFYLRRDDSGMDYALQAFQAGNVDSMPDYTRCISLIPIAQMLCLQGRQQEARPYISEAMRLAHKTHAVSAYTIIHSVFAETCQADGNMEEAEKHYLEGARYIGYTDPGTASLLFLKYGDLLQELGRTDDAIHSYRKGLELSGDNKNMEFQYELLYKTSLLYYKSGDKQQSLEYSLQYMTYSDSIIRKKEHDFNRLILHNSHIEHEKEILQKEVEKQKADTMASTAIFLSIILLSICTFVFSLYRKQLKTYRALVAQHLAAKDKHKEPADTEPTHDKSIPQNRKDIFLKAEALMTRDKAYRHKDITQEKLAAMTGTNRTYLSQAINEYAGMSYNSWINMYRISEATDILSDPSNSISLKQLADNLGYNSISVFHRAFLKGTGMTPAVWRKEKCGQ